MKHLHILSEAADDLEKARDFYESQEEGAGNYFVESAFSELNELMETAGMHPLFFGYHRKLFKKFPFAIYYRTNTDFIDIYAILDLRSRPGFLDDVLEERVK
ncbi:hypothetical protein [Rhodohalobacter mucosus]|uniref:Type II toxin-antitoxin system RelE/ParE family toxin n=1 Tax=Rhodohalobacter mucosus TaxID=2079485 RepID=A0A316TTW1_9BACT|nr:hypothetical protein [Rhodohalobacter mucosus]PWN07870.1 hypothetical protein DDZ15_02345 [Rhodohalobacter mucosus]